MSASALSIEDIEKGVGVDRKGTGSGMGNGEGVVMARRSTGCCSLCAPSDTHKIWRRCASPPGDRVIIYRHVKIYSMLRCYTPRHTLQCFMIFLMENLRCCPSPEPTWSPLSPS